MKLLTSLLLFAGTAGPAEGAAPVDAAAAGTEAEPSPPAPAKPAADAEAEGSKAPAPERASAAKRPDTPPEVPDAFAEPPEGAPERPAPSSAAPLPPAPPDVPESWISRHAWRGDGWFALRAAFGGPLDGAANPPASSRVVGLGWGFELGYRALPFLGVGGGFTRMPHDLVTTNVQSGGRTYVVEDEGRLTTYDFMILRFFVPTRGRFEPWFDLAGGMSVVTPALRADLGGIGGQARAGAGLDMWITPRIALDLSVHYRANIVVSGVGHLMFGAIGAKLHW